jgi:hypothetical protein
MTGMGASASTLDVIGREAHAVDRLDVWYLCLLVLDSVVRGY